jgi:hypothetical protein
MLSSEDTEGKDLFLHPVEESEEKYGNSPSLEPVNCSKHITRR